MANLKDILKENLHQTIEFCDQISGVESEKQEKMAMGYLYSLSISAMILEKFKALKDDKAREAFLQELRAALKEDGEFPGAPPMSHGGGAQA